MRLIQTIPEPENLELSTCHNEASVAHFSALSRFQLVITSEDTHNAGKEMSLFSAHSMVLKQKNILISLLIIYISVCIYQVHTYTYLHQNLPALEIFFLFQL